MKKDKNSKQANTDYKAVWLRLALTCGLIIVGIFNYGCNEDADSYKKSDEYYVKYIIGSSTTSPSGKLNVTINTEKYESMGMVINQNEQWEVIIGPVSKDFNAKLVAVAPSATDNKFSLHSEIHTGRNDSLFVMKVVNDNDISANTIELDYRIDD